MESAQTVANALKDLKPTFVHGLIFKTPGIFFTDQEVADYIYIRKAILSTSPFCKFNVVLDGLKFIHGNLLGLDTFLSDLKNRTHYYPDFVVDAIHFEHWNQGNHYLFHNESLCECDDLV